MRTMSIHTTCFVLAASLAQSAPAAQSTVPQGPGHVRAWSRTFGTSAVNEGPYDLRRAANGDLLVAGSTVVGGASMAGWLLRVDAEHGTLLAQHAFTHPFATTSDGAGLAADGGALFTGRDVLDLFVKHDAWAVRADAAGGVLWSQGFTRPGVGRHFLLDACELADGSWVLCGSAGLTDEPPQQGWLVRLSAAGALLWQFEYGAGSAEALNSVVPTADGGFVAAGASDSSGAGGNDAWVLKVDALGAIQWQRTFGGGDAELATQVVELAGGGYAVGGYSNSFTSSGHAPWVLRLTASGDLAWSRVVAAPVWGDLYGLAESAPGRIVVLGRTNAGDPTNELWAAELAALDGALHWQRAYAGASGDWGSAVLSLQGAGLVLGGVWGWGFAEEDVWLTRTDAEGRLRGCALEHATDFALVAPAVVAQPGRALLRPAGAELQTTAFVSTPAAATALERCP